MKLHKVICKHCGTEYEVDTRKLHLNQKHGWSFLCCNCRPKGAQDSRSTFVCEQCGKEFKRYIGSNTKSKHNHLFCSRSCAAKYNNAHYRVGQKNPNWKGGKARYAAKHIRIAFEAYKPFCALCSESERACLDVHHIDQNYTNNVPDNLVILCANCHRKVHRGLIDESELKSKRELVE